MAATSFTVRQFFALPALQPPLEGGTPLGTFIVTGSVGLPASGLLINNTRTNLSQDRIELDDVIYSGTSSLGWFPGPPTGTSESLIIVGGNPTYENEAADERDGGSKISCWGVTGSTFTQEAYDTAFVTLASQINFEFGLDHTVTDLEQAKTFCESEGFYYQYPVPLDGQSPNTGDGSN